MVIVREGGNMAIFLFQNSIPVLLLVINNSNLFNRIYLSNNKQGKIGIAPELHFLVLCYMPYYRYISLSRKYT
jgi:hypothetical protein